MKNRFISCAVLVAVFGALPKLACFAASGDIDSGCIQAAEKRMQQYIDDGEFAGISTAVVKGGKLIQRADFGFSDLESQRPLPEDAVFRIYSMTKPVVTAGLMTLFDEGKFELDDKVSKYIPAFAQTKVYTPVGDSYELRPQENELTIRHLLTHSSGITRSKIPFIQSQYNETGVSSPNQTLREQIDTLATIPLSFQPGAGWGYGMSIDVAGRLIEILSGEPLDRFLNERIIDPLGMVDTAYFVPAEKMERLTRPYKMKDGKLVDAGGHDPEEPPVLVRGGWGLYSTVGDYIRFAAMLLNGGMAGETRILSERAVKLMISNQLPGEVKHPDPNFMHGLAGIVDHRTGEYGWSGAYSTYFRIDPDQELIVVTMAQFTPNRHHTYGVDFRTYIRDGLKLSRKGK